MPGSPPTRTTPPSTSPPPSTRSRLGRFVEIRGATSKSIASSGTGAAAAFIAGRESPFVSSSAYEFHALQSGQRPSHFGDWLPHSTQEKRIAFLATSRL